MEKGVSRKIRSFLKFISSESMNDVSEFVLNGLLRDYHSCISDLDVKSNFSVPGYITYDEASYIRTFTGTSYFDINSALRDRWTYHENGNIEKRDEFLKLATKIKSLIAANSNSYGDFMCYRGVSLSYFKEYGIESLEDLVSLENKYLVDMGLVSTTLLPEHSFFKKDIEKGKDYNVMIEYMIPNEFTDGIYIGGNTSFTYRPDEHEFLINAGNMSKVTCVKINDDNTAVVKAMVIPKELYDDYYKNNVQRKKSS